MIQCPKCQATLPDWAQQCQFCQTDTSKLAKAVPQSSTYPRSNPNYGQTPKWLLPLYYFLSTLYVIEGAVYLAMGVSLLMSSKGSAFGPLATIPIVVGGASLIIGVGLIAKVEAFRAIANFFSWITIVVNVLSTFSNLMMLLGGNGSAIGGLLGNIVAIATAGGMIYTIAETDNYPF